MSTGDDNRNSRESSLSSESNVEVVRVDKTQSQRQNQQFRTVYDVVNGRLSWHPFSGRSEWIAANEENQRHPVTADEMLQSKYFKESYGSRRGIDAQDDPVPPVVVSDEAILRQLPNSTLLEALHYYAGEYFRANDRPHAIRTLDESALLALGILVEEYTDSLIGPSGHLPYAKTSHEVGHDTENSEGESESESDSASDEDAV